MYLSEDEDFSDFKNEKALFWMEKGLVYGDWETGPNSDGSYEKTGQIQASEVRSMCVYVSKDMQLFWWRLS